MRPHGPLGFRLADSSFQSSLLRMGVGFDMASWSEGEKMGEKGQDRNIDSGELQVSPTELSPK